ncbi:MAG TPA: hypothetical protein VFP76_00965 [Gemmatimonadota bacterium]|nr:hypothetical protein [Gemmatimonadota bacterium]
MNLSCLTLAIFAVAVACSSEAPGRTGKASDGETSAIGGGAGIGRVIGTIRASIDGSERTWFVLEARGRGGPESSAFWYEPEPGASRAMITGYDSPDVTFQDLGAADRPLGDYDGSGITLVIDFRPEEGPKTVRFPVDQQTNVLYMPVMAGGEGSALFQFVEGELDVTSLHAPRSGAGTSRGTFSGTMRDLFGSDRSLVVTGGRFEVEELSYREGLPGGQDRR